VAGVGERAPRRVAFVGFKPTANAEASSRSRRRRGLPRDPQPAGGLQLIAAGCFQDAGQQGAAQPAVRLRVLVAVVVGQAPADERFQVGVVPRGRGPATEPPGSAARAGR
jgi:hypothetical protein